MQLHTSRFILASTKKNLIFKTLKSSDFFFDFFFFYVFITFISRWSCWNTKISKYLMFWQWLKKQLVNVESEVFNQNQDRVVLITQWPQKPLAAWLKAHRQMCLRFHKYFIRAFNFRGTGRNREMTTYISTPDLRCWIVMK